MAAGWHVCDMVQVNIHAAQGVAIREFPLESGYGFTDHLISIAREAEAEANLQHAQALRQAILSKAFAATTSVNNNRYKE